MNEVEAYARLAGVYDEIVVDPCFFVWARYLHELWAGDVVGVHRILDVCCGTGLMDAELADRGYEIVGVDASEPMLARARTLLGSRVTLLHGVLPDLQVDGVFDAAISTFDGLNYLTLDDFRLTLARLAERVRAGGWLVFDLHTDAMLAYVAANPVIEGQENGSTFVLTSEADLEARVCDTWIELSGDADAFTERHRQYFHSEQDVRRALADAGFDLVAVTDEYTDVPAGDGTMRATWISRRHP